MTAPARIFDRARVRRRRERAAAGFDRVGFLSDAVGERIAERLGDVRRTFRTALLLGCRTGALARRLAARADIETVIRADLALAMVRRAGRPGLVCDEEALPFGHGRLDLIVSHLGLHSVNDVPGALVQMRAALRPDGLLLAALPGGRTLVELRHALTVAELEVAGGAAARVAPFMDVRDAGMLLQRAGFALPIVDSEPVTVTYGDALTLMRELGAMGESGLLAERPRPFVRRDVLVRAAEIYAATCADERGRLPATFEILFLTGWAPDTSQQQPARRGSGRIRLTEALAVPPEVRDGRADPHRDD